MRSIKVSGRLTIERAEQLCSEVTMPREYSQSTHVDLSELWDCQIGAGERVGSLLRRLSASDLQVEVGHRDDERAYRTQNWALLVRSGLAVAIARRARRITAGGIDVSDTFRQAATTQGRELEHFYQTAHVHERANLNVESSDAFTLDFYRAIQTLGENDFSVVGDLSPIITFCREAILNVIDHAGQLPFPSGAHLSSHWSLKYISDVRHLKGGSGPVVQFLKSHLGEERNNSAALKFLEVVVCDDGAGIAGRYAQSADIYWDRLERESDVFLRALEKGSSIKPLSKDAIIRGDPGFGLSMMGVSIKQLRAFASIRTGRLLAFCDGTRSGPFGSSFTTAKDSVSNSLGYMPGTLIEALVPVAGKP